MKHHLCFFILLACGIMSMLHAEEQLLPVVGAEKWEPARNAQAAAKFSIDEVEGKKVLHVIQESNEGYSSYRTMTTLPAGDYTLKVTAQGKTDKGILLQCHSFNAEGKPTLLMFHTTEGGVFETEDLYVTFKVPADSTRLRFDLGMSSTKGDVMFWNPNVLKGKVKAPPKKEKEGFGAIPAAQRWVAEVLWFENDPGIPAMDFTKEFTLDAAPVAALCEITADNGYELVVNDKSVGADVDWKSVEAYDLMPYLKKGVNKIVIHARNVDGPAGVIFQAVIMDGKGNATVVATDKSWTVTHTDGSPAILKSFGPDSAYKSHWGVLPFIRINPPTALKVEPIEAIRQVEAGRVLVFKFPLPRELETDPLVEFPGLQIKYFDTKTGEEIFLSGMDPFSRCVVGGREKTLWVEHMTSKFANPGNYRVEIAGKDYLYVIHAGEVTIEPTELPTGCGVRMPKPSLKNYFENDDMKQSLYVYAAENPLRARHIAWSHTGGHFYELAALTGTWSKEMRYDMAAVEKSMLDILELDPLATVNVKFRIDVPGWWVAAHPDDVYRSKQGRSGQQSFCSDIWREDAIQTVINSMEWLAKRPAGKALAGALIMGFRGGEFQLWGEDVGERDVSPVALKAFEEYQQKRNISPKVSLDDPALDYPWEMDGRAETAHARDTFFRFVAERQAENMIFFSNKFKEHFGDKFTFAFYFGYGMEYAGSNMRLLLAGHLGLEDVYEKGTFDMQSCPLSYGLRPIRRSHGFMYPVESARLHNILPIGENDIRNFLSPAYADGSGITLHSMNTSLLDNRRIRYLCAAHGALVRYLGLHSTVDWYDHPAIWRTVREDDAMVMELQANEIGGDDQIAMAVNFIEFTKAWRLPQEIVGRFAGYSRDRLMRTGYGVDYITLRDLLQQPIKWKRVYIPLPGLMTAEQKKTLATKYGRPLPPIKENDGALIWQNDAWSILPSTASDQDIWRAFATKEALEAGYETIWYKGGNFLHTWDGKNLK